MKKLFFISIIALIAANVSARELNTVTWDLTDNDAALGLKLLGEGNGGVFDTIVSNDVEYVVRFVHPHTGAGANTSGLYCHNSTSKKGDNYMELYVPAKTKGELSFVYASGNNAQSYNFFVNCLDASADVPSTLYDTINVSSIKVCSFDSEKSQPFDLGPIELDFLDKTETQVIRIFHVSTTGGRFRTIEWKETEISEDNIGTGLIDNASSAEKSEKVIIDGNLYIRRNDVIYNTNGMMVK